MIGPIVYAFSSHVGGINLKRFSLLSLMVRLLDVRLFDESGLSESLVLRLRLFSMSLPRFGVVTLKCRSEGLGGLFDKRG